MKYYTSAVVAGASVAVVVVEVGAAVGPPGAWGLAAGCILSLPTAAAQGITSQEIPHRNIRQHMTRSWSTVRIERINDNVRSPWFTSAIALVAGRRWGCLWSLLHLVSAAPPTGPPTVSDSTERPLRPYNREMARFLRHVLQRLVPSTLGSPALQAAAGGTQAGPVMSLGNIVLSSLS